MKRLLVTACLCAVAMLLLASPQAMAQNRVFNGDFETSSLNDGWTLFGGNTYTVVTKFQTQMSGDVTWALKRRPGPPSSNGGIETDVPLEGGVTYTFNAWIAAQYCSS
jgi:hypothetical protein